jgi:flagellar biosynthesis/type III secretory pathway protein FliH
MKQHLSTDAEGREWADVEFKANEHIGLGGCAIESRVGTLDARLELQLAALKEILLEARGRMRTG